MVLLLLINTVFDVPVAQVVQVPSYLAVMFGIQCSPREYKFWIFWEMASGIIHVFSTLWFDSGYMSASVYEASGRISRIFFVLVDSGR